MSQDLEKFGMPEEELFAPVDHSDLESEKITAPRYSYWHSVFRVFFKKKINIIILAILGVLSHPLSYQTYHIPQIMGKGK